jgi:hypothetical protein
MDVRADYVMVYFKRGAHLCGTPWSGDLEVAKTIARDGLVRRGADEFQIRANTVDGAIVWHEPPIR